MTRLGENALLVLAIALVIYGSIQFAKLVAMATAFAT